MVFIMKVNNIQGKKFEPGWPTAPVQFLVNMGQKRGNTMQKGNANFSDNGKL